MGLGCKDTNEEYKAWCCKTFKEGCESTDAPIDESTDAPTEKFDCMTKDEWSEDKKVWCCENKKIGCECPEDCSSFFDGCNKHKCYKGATSRCIDCIKKKTCDIKKESKCTWYNCREKKGDESTTWSDDKQEFCCKKKNIGCKFDCMTKDVWSEEKKAWCCENKKLGCECPEDCWTFFDGCNKHKCYKGATSRCIDCFKKKTCDIKKESKC